MILRSIRLENVRRFTDPVEVRGIAPGLNVLTAPNEHGKSTIFDALHAVFFRDRKSWDKRIQSLQPHAGGAPQVDIEIELGGEVYRISKLWKKGQGGSVKVWKEGRLLRQADEAERWISGVLEAPEDGGPAGLLWVRQGQADLDQGDKRGREGAHLARRNLLTSVASEVDAITGGRRMEVARSRVRTELAQYLSAAGRERKGGPLAQKRGELHALQARHTALAKVSRSLREALDERRSLKRELAGWADPQEEAGRRTRMVAAEKAHAEALRYAEQLERAVEAERVKGLEVERARERCDALVKDVLELAEAKGAHALADMAATAAAEQLATEEAAREAVEKTKKEATARATSADRALRRALQKESMAAQQERRQELAEKLRQAEDARRTLEKARAEEERELAASVVEELEQQDAQVRTLRRQRDRAAAAVTMTYLPGREGDVRLDGAALEGGARVSIPEGAVLEIVRVGRLTVHPDHRVDNASLVEAEKQLQTMLRCRGAESIDEARASLRRRRGAEERRRDADVVLRGAAPRGIAALREQVAALPESVEEAKKALPLSEAKALDEAARTAQEAANAQYERRRAMHAEAETRAARGAAALEGSAARLGRAQAALAGMPSPEEEVDRREHAHRTLTLEHDVLARRRREVEKAAPDMQEVADRLDRARSVVRRAEQEERRLRIALGKLDTFIEIQDGAAVEEELADAAEQLVAAEAELAGIEHEVAVLRRLEDALHEAQESARDRYVAPVLQELVPLIRLLWPEAEVRFDAENVLPVALLRAGTEEDFNVLSGGTQEQIALLVRLAFARMLAESGSPAPAIFDDAIVYTDDNRIEALFDALTRQARDLQIIVLSCRQKAFRGLGGRSLYIASATEK